MIELKNISKSYSKKQILKNINLKVKEGEFLILIGESGCGKTTLLKLINKIHTPTEGEILINNINIKEINSVELRRGIGYIIQKVGLMPHMTVGENIEIILKLLKKEKNFIKNRSYELLNLVKLDPEEYYLRYPNELSGGQKQRIGVARALSTNPKIILMDEPFSALDPITRESLQEEILSLHRTLNKTIVFVTHDMDEALKLGTRIVILKDGEIIQADTPEKILKNPANEFVENFVGKSRLWKNPNLLTLKDIMKRRVPKIPIVASLVSALEVMDEYESAFCIVTKKNGINAHIPIGILRKQDINLEQISNSKLTSVKDIMREDFLKFTPDKSLSGLLKEVGSAKVKVIVIVNEKGELIGAIGLNVLLDTLSAIAP